MIEILIYTYFSMNLMLLGSYLFDDFNGDELKTKVFSSVLLFFFGGILVIYEFWLSDKVDYIINETEFGFWYKLNIKRQWDNLDKHQIKYIKNQISAEKEDKNSKLVKHLSKILERNGK